MVFYMLLLLYFVILSMYPTVCPEEKFNNNKSIKIINWTQFKHVKVARTQLLSVPFIANERLFILEISSKIDFFSHNLDIIEILQI